ncbi:dialkylrecorsinol condensing enzyme [Colwellia sp. E2M01]|uniref:dialkylrecorsinol condensing enzyme n=1 Tax=Colwellia sp. E2M01 TaxID=2841561 RepID=UPI001C09B97B|nr:dialkylresorcinol condensing enzyme [Colwellia sp. E2M01]
MRKILVVSYSQTGQLTKVVDSIIEPILNDEHIQVDSLTIKPKVKYPFPWPFFKFFQVMPESVYMKKVELDASTLVTRSTKNTTNRTDIENNDYDLIILSYQVWFLSPSLPISSFLQSDQAKKLFHNTPVMTVIGCRGMWLTAQEKMKSLLTNLQANLVDNIVLTDECGAGFSFLATPLWMLTGKKKPLSWVPPAGISDQEITQAQRFGEALNQRLLKDSNIIETPVMKGLGAVKINEKLIFSEKIGHRSFKIWGKILMLLGPQNSFRRYTGLFFYSMFLLALIVTIVPITALVIKLITPLFKKKIARQKAYYAQPSGE